MTQPFGGEGDKKGQSQGLKDQGYYFTEFFKGRANLNYYISLTKIIGSGFSFCAEVSGRPKVSVEKKVLVELCFCNKRTYFAFCAPFFPTFLGAFAKLRKKDN